MTDVTNLQQLSTQIEDLVRRVESISDPAVKANATVLVQSLLDLHGAAFERVIAALHRESESGTRLLAELGRDEVVGSLLVLYGLHPDSFEVRLEKALERVRPSLASHRTTVELVGVSDGLVHVRLTGKLGGCSSTGTTLQQLVEAALYDAVPEAAEIHVENAISSRNTDQLVQLQLSVPAPRA